ncbi:MAG: glutamate 5-kinase [Nitrososphaerota archaeon]|jgi:glutamate 5-kinase|nr:glutamate 5-kinase [Nitrososphaerota archaeon]
MPSKVMVVKVGTSSVTDADGKLDEAAMQNLAHQISDVLNQGTKVVLVTSGAVAAGVAELSGLGFELKAHDIVSQQVAAATGQSVLMEKYRSFFRVHNIKVAQFLITAENLSSRKSCVHIQNALKELLSLSDNIVPIINENDVVSTTELDQTKEKDKQSSFSDNDVLSVLVAANISADLVVILSDVDGLYTAEPSDPAAKLIPLVDDIASVELDVSFKGKSKRGRGGIQSKLKAAKIATSCGIPVVIANSRQANVIRDVSAGKKVGTLFKATGEMSARESWIAYGASIKGSIQVNNGAKQAILNNGSLLAVGVTNVNGVFDADDVVCIKDECDKEFARGKPKFNNLQLNQIKGLHTSKIPEILKGSATHKEVISADDMYISTTEKSDKLCTSK